MALNNVFQLANKMYSNVEGYRQQAVDSHREQLRNVVDMTESISASALTMPTGAEQN